MTRQRRERALRDEPVDVEAVEESADLGPLLFPVMAKMASELGAEVAVREAVHGELPLMRAMATGLAAG